METSTLDIPEGYALFPTSDGRQRIIQLQELQRRSGTLVGINQF